MHMELELGISHEMEEVLSTDWVPVVFITVSVSTLIQRAHRLVESFFFYGCFRSTWLCRRLSYGDIAKCLSTD